MMVAENKTYIMILILSEKPIYVCVLYDFENVQGQGM